MPMLMKWGPPAIGDARGDGATFAVEPRSMVTLVASQRVRVAVAAAAAVNMPAKAAKKRDACIVAKCDADILVWRRYGKARQELLGRSS